MNLRPLTAADYRTVLALWQRSDGVEVAEGDDEAGFRSYLQRNPDLSVGAEIDGRIVGAALCGHDGRRGLIYHLAVEPEFRGHGIGRAIVQAGLLGLREAGIARTLILVSGTNATGLSFWTSQGFEPISGALALGIDLL